MIPDTPDLARSKKVLDFRSLGKITIKVLCFIGCKVVKNDGIDFHEELGISD